LSADLEITLYRVLQESLTNAAKYAQAGSVRVSLQCDPSRCSLDVVDDGTGFRIDQIRADAQGLFGMRHRVEARSGHFTVVSAPGAGTRISVIIPRRVPSIPVPAAPHEPQRVEWETVQA
jgi:signal transduction histidine kinase